MDGLYQSPPYAYLPQQNSSADNNYHSQTNTLQHHTTFDRPFHHLPQMNTNNNDTIDSYNNNWSNQHHHYHHHHHPIQIPSSASFSTYGLYPSTHNNNNNSLIIPTTVPPRPKMIANLWEDEGTLCYQVDAKGICVARRQDNDMINGTKLLNVVGMSRGKRDGILKNEKGRVVVKVGAMHLKGVWIPFTRAKELATKFKILDYLFPLFVEEPSYYLCNNAAQANNASVSNKCNMVSSTLNYRPSSGEYGSPSSNSLSTSTWDRSSYSTSSFMSHHYDQHSQQVLHRASLPDLSLTPSSRTNPSIHNASDDLYLLNNNNNPYDFYSRQLNNNRSNVTNYLYSSSLQHENDIKPSSGTTRCQDNSKADSKLSPVNIKGEQLDDEKQPEESVGSTTPKSWFSPETPTAVLFQNNRKRKTISSMETTTTIKKVKRPSIISPTCSPRRIKIETEDSS
ncbi:uncharacterized protein BX663DRAFT_525408 [Cokeromyces recurvatus]|uniref:uncharacterized protein n=1 Tax=Cokeromyces recurvatus TaxID=90255 RepID=UPI00221F32D4|nr:uncharacterized protein BX663DRAFT_525408 [Cokeromyces recurvatus]KAI7898317.1 hypothetical protein BX663DRAFT_525408 [Cokeromyces recurvatus]